MFEDLARDDSLWEDHCRKGEIHGIRNEMRRKLKVTLMEIEE